MDVKATVQQALGYYELGLFSEADALLETVVSGEPLVEFQHLRILVKIDRGEWELANAFAVEAISHFPERAFGYIQRAYVLHELGRTAEAAAVLGAAPDESKDSVEDVIHYNLACYLAQTGQLDAALEKLKEALTFNTALIEDAREDVDLEPIREQIDLL
jgi:tetratricopeptide (TPR) repeat protein